MALLLIDEGCVLHRYPYRETSMILEFFLQNHGRVSLLARGVRTQHSPLKGWLQPFAPLHIEAKGRHTLKTIIRIEPAGAPIFLQNRALLSGWYLNELLMRLLPKEEAHTVLYLTYRQTLCALSADTQVEKTLRIFEKNLLACLGYALPLLHEADSGKKIENTQYYQFIAEYGFVRVAQQIRRDIFIGEDLTAISEDDYPHARVLLSAKRLMRLALQSLLGGKPLKTRELFAEMQSTLFVPTNVL